MVDRAVVVVEPGELDKAAVQNGDGGDGDDGNDGDDVCWGLNLCLLC